MRKKEKKKKSKLLIFFYRQEYILLLDFHTFLYMSDTGQNFSTLLLKCFLRSWTYVYLNINMYTSTLSTSVMSVDAFLSLLRFIIICLLHQLIPLRPSCKNIQLFVYQMDVSKEQRCTDDVRLIIYSYHKNTKTTPSFIISPFFLSFPVHKSGLSILFLKKKNTLVYPFKWTYYL